MRRNREFFFCFDGRNARWTMFFDIAAFACLGSLPLYSIGGVVYATCLLRGEPSRHAAPRRLFAASFSLSLSLLALVVIEVLGWLSVRGRWMLWRACLLAELALLVVILPHSLLSLLTRRLFRLRRPWIAAKLAAFPFLLWLWLFYKLGEPFPLQEAKRGVASLCLSRAGVIGVAVMALVSGNGAVTAPTAALLRALFPVSDVEVREAERASVRALHALLQGRRRLASLEMRLRAAEARVRRQEETLKRHAEDFFFSDDQVGAGQSTWLRWFGRAGRRVIRAVPSGLVQAGATGRSSLAVRAAAAELSALRGEFVGRRFHLAELLEQKKRAAFASTARGALDDGLSAIFGVYCVHKVSPPRAQLDTT